MTPVDKEALVRAETPFYTRCKELAGLTTDAQFLSSRPSLFLTGKSREPGDTWKSINFAHIISSRTSISSLPK
jgi:hypothetical protein